MSINPTNNSINSWQKNKAYFMMPPASQPMNSENTVSSVEQLQTPAKVDEKNKSETAKAKYIIGACAIAASVIAGICIYRSKSSEQIIKNAENILNGTEQTAEQEPEIKVVTKTVTDFIKTFEDKIPEFDIRNSIVSTFKNGIERVDRVLDDAGINVSEFFNGTETGKTLFGRFDWNDENKIVSGFHIDASGNKNNDLNKTAEYIFNKLEEPSGS